MSTIDSTWCPICEDWVSRQKHTCRDKKSQPSPKPEQGDGKS